MPFAILILFLLVVGVFLFIKIRKSKWVENLTNNLVNEPEDHDPETDKVIEDIGAAEIVLKEQASTKKEEAERLQEEASTVGDFLASRNVVKPEEGKETNSKTNGG